ncbi:putative uncharacterized protein DDB_G0291812 isoform X1 [Rhopalosiphum maidis]|uniref:putative uncharacterized protein DDB_G0291812 isoform X1 n=1 Tax=Rhopalosiphum maidis TaxID=43146 RepID=UPI000EFEF830|nr:putative uncharacterized protein DDB_G0291812 isoform X1 [Rhopalosiphum maidis]XP_026815739.1 putative uncharacterized protein DDB_G0291812 isoform X1 [Rhopalosiphum maidis]
MKVSPLLPQTSAKKQAEDVPIRDDSEAANNCLKRRRLHSQTNIIINGHYRHHSKHHYSRHDDNKSSSMDCFDTISNSVNGNSNSSCNSSNSGEDASDCDDSPARPNSHPNQQYPEGGTSAAPSPAHNNDKNKDGYQQTTAIGNNNSCSNGGDCMTPAIRHTVQQLAINSDDKITLSLSTHSEKNNDSETYNSTHEPILSSISIKNLNKNATTNEKTPSVVDTDVDDPMVTVNDINSETSNDDCLSQSPLNLTRSQGSSEGGNKSGDDDEEYDDDSEEKNGIGNSINENENIVKTEVPFPWNITSANNKQKQQHQDDKITAPPPQLLLTSGQLTTGCLQAAQLLIPTARGIMTQTILAIPINDMVSSAITTPTSNQQQLQQQLLYHSTNNVRQKNINRQQLNQICQPSLSLPLNRYFQQHQTTADDSTTASGTPDNVNNDNNNYDGSMINNDTVTADQYNNIQRRKWQSPDLNCKKHNFLTPQQKLLPRTKNEESSDSINAQRSKDSTMVQIPTGTNGDCRIYSTNNAASIVTAATPMSPPTLRRNDGSNGGGVEVIQRQTVWPTAITATDQHNGGDETENEEDKQQPHQPSHVISPAPPTSSTNINTLKSLAPPSSQLNCHIKPSKDEDSTSAAAAAAAAYNQQNAICTALATHMLCASQLAAAQQPIFENMESGNSSKKPNNVYNNNNNNIKTNNMMGVVNPAVLEKWMMEERYYYNNNNNNNKNITGGHSHHQRYNAAAAAAAAAAAVELLSGGVSASSSGGGGDSLASCKKRKRRTSFTPHALELLNGHFERNTHPSGSEITGLAHRLGYEREVIRIWFCNKRQALKNTVRTINGSGPAHMTSTKSHNNTSGY